MLKRPPHRLSYRERKEVIDLPNLIEVQIKSYDQFLQMDKLPHERANSGLQEVFLEIFPIKSYDEKTVLEFISYSFGAPKYSPEECLRKGVSFCAPLKVRFRVVDETGIKEEDVYMGTIPLMTPQGTFVINGAERVVVSQMHRSPGISVEQERVAKGLTIYSFRIIPYRGSWLEGAFDSNDLIYIYVDRKKRRRKILATSFMRTLGFSTDADILAEFFEINAVHVYSEKDFPSLVGQILAANVIDSHTEVQFGKAGEKLTTAMLKRMLDAGISALKIAVGADENSPIIKMLVKDPTDSYESALKDFYRKLRPGEPATLSNARSAIMRYFFDPRRYNLGRVGRFKLNRKLGFPINEETLSVTTLRKEDVVGAIRYLVRIKQGDDAATVDDIDHLGNRRVRSVGELVQNQCRIGLSRAEKVTRERMNLFDFTSDTLTPGKIVSAKALAGVLKDFFGRSQLSQFMDQTNPVAELTHKRRLSSLGPGGLNRERAGFEVRDVHGSHYGRFCPIETPEGPNIGLITSLASYAKINEFGFIEAPYLIVRDGVVTDEVEYMTADQEEQYVIAQATTPMTEERTFSEMECWARYKGESLRVDIAKVTHMEVSPKQMVSVVTGHIPFLEHDDANRALMGSNMQRQAVPPLIAEAPIVGTGLELRAARDSGAVVVALEDGTVEYVDGIKIVVAAASNPLQKRNYTLKKFLRSNAGTCLNQTPLCSVGDKVLAGDILADGSATDRGEVALGKNVLVAFMPWCGFNMEDGIIAAESLLIQDVFTSVHIEAFEATARGTKLGEEELTRDIPNISEDALKNLDDSGVVRVGAEVRQGDILVGKVTPRTETELNPEERLLHSIFADQASDVKDASLVVPPGIEGVVMSTQEFNRRDRLSKTDDELVEDASKVKSLHQEFKRLEEELLFDFHERMGALMMDEIAPGAILHRKSGDTLILEGVKITQEMLELLENERPEDLLMGNEEMFVELKALMCEHAKKSEELQTKYKVDLEWIRKGDVELEPGVVRQVKVHVVSKRKLQVGDKMAGRHGNKGVVAKIVPDYDMPYFEDGVTVQLILNPLGVPSRMNLGQMLETHLGRAAKATGIYVKVPVFEGFPESRIWELMEQANLATDGKSYLYDGKTGERFEYRVVVGYIYMFKLNHLVADKMHARSTGPYSLVTQQPLGGKSQQGGQRFGEMEVWAVEAYGAGYLLQEMLTVKSDDVPGRSNIYQSIVDGTPLLKAGVPESFNVLMKEMKGLALDVRTKQLGESGVSAAKDVSLESVMLAFEHGKSVEFDALSIALATPEVIRGESRGVTVRGETLNYRSFRPEKGGLFCEKIYGPTRDWECACGKYKKIKNKGIVCDRCGVEVTLSKVRRERMSHIELAVPVVHIWYFKTTPSRIGNILGISSADLERVIYYENFIVVDPKSTTLQKKQLLNEVEYNEAKEKWGVEGFVAKMGGEAVYDLLKSEDLALLVTELKERLRKTKSMQARMKLAKRLKVVESFANSGNNPTSMVLFCVPVIPPDLRPLVPLEGGRFATADLNDLYKRLLLRNIRLRRLIAIHTPGVILRNEMRMLQEAVDALMDNGRHGHPVVGAGNRPLKSLSELLKGKPGRFRLNLLGKRVDYSGRSVVVGGPDFALNQVGLPKLMALELFEPFIVRRLKELQIVYTVKAAKRIIQRQEPIVWDILAEVIKGHPVLLNRAPTLHRLGIQAFEPVLIEGKAIRIHPLVCTAFNADFDGDQMGVHVPLSAEARLEARLLMMAPDNIFLPSSGKPVAVPSQDMILGLYCLMQDPLYDPEKLGDKVKVFSNCDEVLMALSSAGGSYNWFADPLLVDDEELVTRAVDLGRGMRLNEKIKLRLPSGELIETTPGRVVFNTIVPPKLGFQNYVLRKKKMGELISLAYKEVGLEATVRFLDDLKNLGFKESTRTAVSMGLRDVLIPETKAGIIAGAHQRVAGVTKQYEEGTITDGERRSKVIGIWTEASDVLSAELFECLAALLSDGTRNPLFLMMDSGARGNKAQVKQLGALRGLMAKPNGQIIETPIISNFREGLSENEYYCSTHGGRKGLADTALKTADSGYLTRRLVDVAQDVIVTEIDCGTLGGIEMMAIRQGQEDLLPLKDRIYGRFVCDDIYRPGDRGSLLAKAETMLTKAQAEAIDDAGIESVKVRSVLSCEARRGVCAKCYGANLATGAVVSIGEAVGIIAAQSIGEPGTQLTMRTFHTGGIASGGATPELISEHAGILVQEGVRTVLNQEGVWLVLNKSGMLHVVSDSGRSLDEYKRLIASKSLEPLQSFAIELGTTLLLADGAKVPMKGRIGYSEQHSVPIICERPGFVKYEDLLEGISTQRVTNKKTGQKELIVKQHRGDLHPQIMVYADHACKELVGAYAIPFGAYISVEEGQEVFPGMSLARLPRSLFGTTRDIVGGLPRVAELLEGRKPRDAADIARIDGVVDIRGQQKNRRIVVVRDEASMMEEEHLIPLTKHLIVQRGDVVVKGQQLTDGLVAPQEILEYCGRRELQRYLGMQVQEVYCLQGVDINDKHIEIIIRQMLQKVRVVEPGDTTLLFGEDVDKRHFHKVNAKAIAEGGRPAKAAPVLLGITRASLVSDSFVSAASFQETTKVLTDAACAGKEDYLLDFKSNLIVGHTIPGGTCFHLKRSHGDSKVEERDLLEFDFADLSLTSS